MNKNYTTVIPYFPNYAFLLSITLFVAQAKTQVKLLVKQESESTENVSSGMEVDCEWSSATEFAGRTKSQNA